MAKRGAMVALALAIGSVAPAMAAHLDQRTQEQRMVLYYVAAPEVLAAVLPAGWEAMPLAAGPAKGATLTVNISDQITAVNAQGAVAGDARGEAVTISARVRNPTTGENCAMVLFGMTNGADAPGPYLRHHKAAVTMARSAHTGAGGEVQIEESWDAATPEGDGLHLDLAFPRGPATVAHNEQETHSGEKPAFFRIYKMDLVQDTVLSRSAGVDRTRTLSVRASGQAEKLLQGANLVAVVSVPVYRREIWLPD